MLPRMTLRFVLVLALGVSCVGAPEGVKPSGTPSSPPASVGRSTFVAYVDDHDLWLYDMARDIVRPLTEDREQRFERDPAFLDDSELLYNASSSTETTSMIEAIPIGGGAPREIVRDEGRILDFDLSPDSSMIAYLTFKHVGETAHRLKVVRLSGGNPKVLRTLGQVSGRGAGSEDEVSVDWSPNGKLLLVTDTHVDQDRKDGISLLDRRGREEIPRWTGTHARWSPDGRTVYFRGHAEAGNVDWFALDLKSKRTKELTMRRGTNNPAIAPDGSSLVYDTSYFGDMPPGTPRSREAPAVYRYELPGGPEVRVKGDAMAPLWISSGDLLVTDVMRPGAGAPTLNSWEMIGTVTRVSADGATSRAAMTSTYDAAVLLPRT